MNDRVKNAVTGRGRHRRGRHTQPRITAALATGMLVVSGTVSAAGIATTHSDWDGSAASGPSAPAPAPAPALTPALTAATEPLVAGANGPGPQPIRVFTGA